MKTTDPITIHTADFTRDDYLRLPEGFPAELIRGQLVKEPAPTSDHQGIVVRLTTRFARAAGEQRVLVSPIDVFVDDRNVLQPDVLLLREGDEWRLAVAETKAKSVPLPLLVAEVLSRSTARRDRDVKTEIYLEAGVAEVWLVDLDARRVEVRTVAGRRVVVPPASVSTPLVPGLEVSLEELFV